MPGDGKMSGGCPFASRRGFIAAAGGLAGALGARAGLGGSSAAAVDRPSRAASATEPFYGAHQGGILTERQSQTYFAAFDLATARRADVADLMRRWTDAAATMATGRSASGDSGEAADLSAARLTLTFGFGPGLFVKDGHDRFGLAAMRPAALVDMPSFNGDQLEPSRTGGDLSVQACAEDPQVAFHAVREMARLAEGVAAIRWVQSGFCGNFASGVTPRNLMGFKDGSLNPGPAVPGGPNDVETVVWAGDEGPAWMRGGSYLVTRRIRIALEHWDRTDVDFQEQVIGRRKPDGAPLGGRRETDTPDLAANGTDGNPVIAEDAHVRLAHPSANGGARILRRAYSYNDGANITAERWPPWRHGLEYDAGLFFIAYQRDPRDGFIRMFDRMSRLDALNQFTTHVGSGLFACPPGARPGGYVGETLLRT